MSARPSLATRLPLWTLLRLSAGVYWRELLSTLAITLLVAIPLNGLRQFVPLSPDWSVRLAWLAVGQIIVGVVGAFSTITIAYRVQAYLGGWSVTPWQAFKGTLRGGRRLVWTSFWYYAGTVGLGLLGIIGLGFALGPVQSYLRRSLSTPEFLLLLGVSLTPAILAYVFWTFAQYLASFESLSGAAALVESTQMVKRHWLKALLRLTTVGAGIGLVSLAITVLIVWLPADSRWHFLTGVVGSTLISASTSFSPVFVAVWYFNERGGLNPKRRKSNQKERCF